MFHDWNGKKLKLSVHFLKMLIHMEATGSDGGGSYRASGGYGGAGRVDSNRFSQQNPSSGGFLSYGNSSAYGESGYKYGVPNNGMGYGGGYVLGNAVYVSHGDVVAYGSRSPVFIAQLMLVGPKVMIMDIPGVLNLPLVMGLWDMEVLLGDLYLMHP
ncbi:hypothetical protein MLD38_016987 [Melastoma candidum]|uniref:Uncharacterized protein n=1 Tax=Melastoma candidum TaxID=119954 RepID=A0ACB9QP70_9MYRT|nr:hypothetical protein MLD38_016987 [Melastoma candidum]